MTRPIVLAALAAALHGCACDSVPDAAVSDCELDRVIPAAVKTDILFVIDDSGSMSQEQANLQANLDAFIQVLHDAPIRNDFQVGVTTTSVSNFAGGAVGLQGALIGPILDGDSPDLVADFAAQVGLVGTVGSGKEQPFRAMRLALTPPLTDAGQPNEGLLRPGARLAVVFLSDEDDASESGGNLVDSNDKSHNDGGDGVDYKFTVLDPVGDYVSFLRGPLGGEAREVVLAAIVGVDASTLRPTCGNTADSWCCGSASNGVCVPNTCGLNDLTIDGLAGDTWCCGDAAGACVSTCATAYDKADRFVALLQAFGASRTVTASVCDASFATALEEIAGEIVSTTLPLEGEPADYRMLVVGIRRADGSRTSCTVALAGSADAATADVVYEPAQGGSPAALTFQQAGGCALEQGDEIQIDLICAG